MAQDQTEKVKELQKNPKQIRNIAIAAHIDHGKTTFSDNLLAGAGMMSEALAGKARTLDFHEDETERGITIDSASVSMVHTVEGSDYLINLIDTPGHVDFGGDVTRAMRAVDGAIVLTCASEGIMPQTETVLRQALKERVKPILFINKVDRLIREVKLTPEEMQKRFIDIINDVNKLIMKIAEPGYGEKWQVSVADGSVAFGSAFHNWALSIPYMKKKNISFKEIIDSYEAGGEVYKELAKKAPIHEVVLNMVVDNHPNPVDAQEYRIPKIWHGDLESDAAKDLMACNIDGEVAFVPIKIVIDPHAGEVAAGRLFGGRIKQGDELHMNIANKTVRVQQVSIYKGAQRVQLDEVVAGNIVGIVGLRDVVVGETVSKNPIEPFEAISHLFEPVVTKSISAKRTADLPKLIEVLRQVGKEDPSLRIEINEETGESLMSGMGELHLEIIENRIKTEKGLEIEMGPPIVVFRESVVKASSPAEGRSPNKHNSFFITVEPLEDSISEAIAEAKLPEGRIKKKDKTLNETLVELGISRDEAQQYRNIYKGCVFLDKTKGIVQIGEVIELLLDAFEQVMDAGPLSREPCHKMKISVVDMKLHEDAIHRGPAQVYPAVRDSIKGAFRSASPTIFEPVQVHQIEAPIEFMGAVTSLVSTKRGSLVDVQQDAATITVRAELPVQEMIGWTSDLRSATEGRGISALVSQTFKKMPNDFQAKVIKQIRERKGLSENQ
ncbi:elongation factor EF-2 [archaeon]|jgi:elongation factor 2|nr:elongation factor EF-2 [archaeon]MBT3577576.1 elongation factor EF-2 [archaeon]MBT6820087.1 elongation factor EF-2 [archaeon]MBT7025311.1 elongation factor EF-2 [archaeon]MBT7238386.1 elongation factor EF-2 [archaeon]